MQLELRDQVALVTGSAHRVGKAIALELARAGVHQAIHYNGSADEADRTLAEVRALGVDTIAVRADLADLSQIDQLFAAITAHFGKLHILVNSAAIFQRADLLTLSDDDWARTLNINLTAPFRCSQRAVRLMRAGRHGGVIINLSDTSGRRATAAYPHHSVSKAGLLMLTEVSALAFAPDVRVNAIMPGAVLKPPDYSEDTWQKLAARTPVGRPGSAEDVARAALYLAREDYLTGTVLTVDGGESIR